MATATATKELRAARLASQLLAGRPAASVEAVVERLLAVQAQDERGFRLAIRPRSSRLSALDVERSLTSTRSLVVTWLNRGTLHLVSAKDYWWMHPLTTPQLGAANRRRLGQEGVSVAQAERGIEAIVAAIAADGPQSRSALCARLAALAIPTAGQALIHLLLAASIRGLIVRGPVLDGEHAYVGVAEWLGNAPPGLDRGVALGRLARRYLAGHAPARPSDLAKWAGITLGDARRGFDAITGEAEELPFGFVLADSSVEVSAMPSRLLGAFDPLLHGWASRGVFVGDHGGVVTSNGIFRPVALVEGRVVATWRLATGEVVLDALERLGKRAEEELREEASDVVRFLVLG
jgi:hypothetical protein